MASPIGLALLAVPPLGPAPQLASTSVAASSFARLGAGLAGLPEAHSGLVRGGTLPAGAPLQLELVLRPRDAAGLAELAQAVSTPGSALFHHRISLAQFSARFGAPSSELRRVESGLHAAGLSRLVLAPNGLVLDAPTTVSTAERAFSTTLYRYAEAGNGGVAGWAADSAPRVSSAVAEGVSAVVGLDSIGVAHPAGLEVGRPEARRPAATVLNPVAGSCAAGAGAGLTPAQVASAYGFDKLYGDPTPDLGQGSSVAIIEFAPYSASDVATYAACYGLSAAQVSGVNIDGGASPDPDGSIEADLDVEELLGLVPDASITVVQAPNTDAGSIDAFTKAIDGGAQVVATSWGLCEAALDPGVAAAENELFEQASTMGVSVIAASGDEGSEDCTASTGNATTLQVDDPASQPYVTGVGGTTLTVSPRSEVAWNNGTYAGGGGISTQWSMPAYQSSRPPAGVVNPNSSGAPCKAAAGDDCREVPDVSANAGDAFGIYTAVSSGHSTANAWVGVEGTSAAAPAWAALLALADSSVACDGKPVGFANPTLYAIAAGPHAADALNDITEGDGPTDNSTNPGYSQLYPITPGYNMVTGLGTPLAGPGLGDTADDGLVSQLCQGVTSTAASPGGTSSASATASSGSPAAPAGNGGAAGNAGAPPGASAPTSAGPGSPGTAATRSARAGRPVLAHLSPARGPAEGGTVVTLHGVRLARTVAVWFGSRRARLVSVLSSSTLRVVTPPGEGSVRVRVRTRYGSSTSPLVRFSYADAPLATSSGPA